MKGFYYFLFGTIISSVFFMLNPLLGIFLILLLIFDAIIQSCTSMNNNLLKILKEAKE